VRRRGRLGPLLVAALAATAALLPAAASGSVRLGPDVTQPLPSGGFHFAALGCQAGQYSPCAFINLRSTNPDALVAAPTDGVVTSWSLRGGCCTDPQTVTRVLKIGTFKLGKHDGFSGYGYAVPDLVGPSFELPPGNQFTADVPLTLPARMPISAGERVGIIAENPISLSVYDTIPSVTSVSIANGQLYDGEGYGLVYAAAMAISAVVEPDADHDGYGDETQDCQPADPALHGTDCTPVVVLPPPPPLPVGGVPCSPGGCGTGPSTYVSPPQVIPGPSVPASSDGIHFYIPLACPAGAAQPCGGFLVIVPSGATKAAHSAATTYARTSYSIAPGASAKVKLTLSRAARKLLKQRRRLKVTIQIQPTGGTPTTVARTLVARTPKKR
jgi:hypothetical protein